MRVLLVRAKPNKVENTRLPKSLSSEVGYVMPLGLASIAAYLRGKGVSVGIIDAEAEELSIDQVKKKIARIGPEIVGITSMTPTFHDDLAIARVSHELGIKVVMGGPQINAMPEETMQFEFVDLAVRGEGEYPMLKIIQAIDNNLPFSDVPGIVYRDGDGRVIMTPPFIHDDLDELPPPARDLLPYERYAAIISRGRLTTLCPGRGCPFRCGFCFKQPSDQKIRFRSPEVVADEMEEVIDRYGIQEINFVSDTFTLKKSFVEGLCEELLSRGIKVSWIAPTRVDSVTPELLGLMKKAGCRSLRFGIESGSEKILRLMNKDTDKKHTVRVFRWAKEAGLETFAYLIIGYLQETEKEIKETLAFVKELKPDLLMYNAATPLPKTRLFQQAVEAGIVEKDYWEKFLLDEDYPRIPYLMKDTQKWIDKAYRDFFFSPRFLFKKMIEFRGKNIKNYFRATRGIVGIRKQ
ncbi:MAG: radical SAM protein [Deltaproteobacteria bacterium]|nr:radical SAM protein [Deltaproteobacteria bacterium]